MGVNYYIQKMIRKLFDRPCIKKSQLNRGARIDIGSVCVQSVVGKYSYIGEHSSVLYAEIGNYSCISNYCAIGGGSHPISWVSMSPVFNTSKGIIKKKFGKLNYNPFEKVKIGNDVWIGSHCMIKSGIQICDGAVIGMGSVVVKDVGPYEIWAGNPAKLIKRRFDDGTIQQLIETNWWNADEELLIHYSDLMNSPVDFLDIWGEKK